MRREPDGLIAPSPGRRLVDGETYLFAGGRRDEIGVLVNGDSTPLLDTDILLVLKDTLTCHEIDEWYFNFIARSCDVLIMNPLSLEIVV